MITVTAICPLKTLTGESGDSYHRTMINADGYGQWVNSDGDELDDAGLVRSAERVNDQQFKLLCPSYFKSELPAVGAVSRDAYPFVGNWNINE